MTGPADEQPLMTRPWADIADFYRWLVKGGMSIGANVRLVEQVEGSCYARGLHAWTSMHDLCIVQVPCTFPYDGPYLRISPRFDGTIEFRYIDTPFYEKQWRRVVKEEAPSSDWSASPISCVGSCERRNVAPRRDGSDDLRL
jgi:hypothetical protein